MDQLLKKWRDLLLTGGVHVTTYALDPKQGLFTISDGNVKETVLFLLDQDEVVKITHDSHNYVPERLKKASSKGKGPAKKRAVPRKSKKRKKSKRRKTPKEDL